MAGERGTGNSAHSTCLIAGERKDGLGSWHLELGGGTGSLAHSAWHIAHSAGYEGRRTENGELMAHGAGDEKMGLGNWHLGKMKLGTKDCM